MKVSVSWETDGLKVKLPKVVALPVDVYAEYIANEKDPSYVTDYLSDAYGWLVEEWCFRRRRNK